MANIEKIIEDAKLELEEILDDDIPTDQAKKEYLLSRASPPSVAEALYDRAHAPLKLKAKVAQVLDNLKIELVSGMVVEEGVQAKNQYEIVYLKVNSSKIELQEDDIPIGYQAYRSMFSSGSSSGTGAGGQEIVREVIVLRPVLLNVPMKLVEEKS